MHWYGAVDRDGIYVYGIAETESTNSFLSLHYKEYSQY